MKERFGPSKKDLQIKLISVKRNWRYYSCALYTKAYRSDCFAKAEKKEEELEKELKSTNEE